jgi:hypothetical protein
MKKLSKSLHRTLSLLKRDEEQKMRNKYFCGSSTAAGKVYDGNRKRLLKRGYLVQEARRTSETSWSIQLWLTEKGKRYIEVNK